MKNYGLPLMMLTIGFLLAYVISDSVRTSLITGTTTADNLINNLWQLILAAVGMMLLVTIGFKQVE